MHREDLLSLSLSIGSTKKRKGRDHEHSSINNNLTMSLLQSRDRMLRLHFTNPHSFNDGNGHRLIRLLLLCASATDRNDTTSTSDSLLILYRHVSLSGDPIQRVAAYFTDALFAKLLTPASPFYASITAKPTAAEEFSAFTALYRASPYYQFAHFTANQAITEAFEAEENCNRGCLHVVDFDVSYGFQWPSLIQSLSDKSSSQKPITLRITGFGRSVAELKETETRLSCFAKGFRNLRFEFDGKLRGATKSLKDLNLHKKRSTVAVNIVFAEVSPALMCMVQSLNPSLVVLVEKEGGRILGRGFLSRFVESLHHFTAMFDSLNDCLPAESGERLRIEKNHLGREIRDDVVMEDEEEKGVLVKYGRLEDWKLFMERNGFEVVRMSSRSVSQAKILLKIRSHCSAMEGAHGFRISEREDGKAISLGWQERHLVTATAWRCSE